MKLRIATTVVLATGGLVLASCSGSNYTTANGTAVPNWATDVVKVEDDFTQGKITPQQVDQSLWAASFVCSFKSMPAGLEGTPMNPEILEATDQEFCTKIGPWLARNSPGGGFGLPAPVENTQPAAIVKSWNETAHHSSGLVITVEEPVAAGTLDSSSGVSEAAPGDPVFTVEVTVVNQTGHEVNNPGFTETRTDKGAATSWAGNLGTSSPSTMLPGDEATWVEEISVPKGSTELRLEWATGGLPGGQYSYEGLHFRGPLP